jgi:hypothetical protein
MITIDLTEREERRKFLNRAIKNFEKNPQHWTYGDIEQGELYAQKYGADSDCVIVFRIAAADVELYPNVIKVED